MAEPVVDSAAEILLRQSGQGLRRDHHSAYHRTAGDHAGFAAHAAAYYYVAADSPAHVAAPCSGKWVGSPTAGDDATIGYAVGCIVATSSRPL